MKQIILFMRNCKTTFWKRGMFFGSELRSSVRVFHGSENFGLHLSAFVCIWLIEIFVLACESKLSLATRLAS